jgi:hypothetical protein
MTDRTKQIIKLRLKGIPYNEIARKLGTSKGNVHYVCNKYVKDNDKLIKENRHRVFSTGFAARRKGFYKYHANNCIIAKERWLHRLHRYSDQSLVHYVSGLYDGEGNHTGTGWQISNSNPHIVGVIVKFLSKVLRARFIGTLYLHKTHDKRSCIRYWKSFGVPVNSLVQKDDRRQCKNNTFRENHGTMRVTVRSPLGLNLALSEYSYKIK